MKNLQKTMQFIILLILTVTLLVSCGKQNAPLTTKTGTSGALVTTGTVQMPAPVTRRNRPIKPATSSGTSMAVVQEKMLERVKNIATLDDLAAFSS